MAKNVDFLIIGGGIVGINTAHLLKEKHPNSNVIVLEKEESIAYHSSGRNSGVLHAGFYYTADSLKAKFTMKGNQFMRDYCDEYKIRIRKCGKLVVTTSETDITQLEELFSRAQKNHVTVERIPEEDIKRIEPRAKTLSHALYSPNTCSVDPVELTTSMKRAAEEIGVIFRHSEYFVNQNKNITITNLDTYDAGYIINAAGLQADQIALQFGFSQNHRILPFKGLYIYSDEPSFSFQTHIYPVPNIKNPFLGVHFTVTVDGKVKIGPTAIPALWREQYRGLDRFKFNELYEILFRQFSLALHSNFDFKSLAIEEIKKYSKKYMVDCAAKLAEGIRYENYKTYGKPGMRAQLIDIKKKKLEMDFLIEGDSKSLHILNAVSPGFTCARPFAEYILGEVSLLIG